MDKKTFWKQFTELANSEKAREKVKQKLSEERIAAWEASFLEKNFVFEGIEQIEFMTFDSKKIEDLTTEEQDKKFAQIKQIMKEQGSDADIDFDMLIGGMSYDPKFVEKICSVLPVNNITISINLRRKKNEEGFK